MFTHYEKWFNVKFTWTIAICLLIVNPVELFPRREKDTSKNQRRVLRADNKLAQLATLMSWETLNSKLNGANAKNGTEKPVFNASESNNQNKESVTNATESEASSNQARQLTMPFMAVPANWMATFQPSNAVILAQKVPLRIWAIGSVSRFPSFLEKFVQRVQAYYSIYKYHDLSRPASLAIINPQYHLHDTSTEVEPIDHDSVEEDTMPSIEYLDTTTDMNYLDEDGSTESTEDDSFGDGSGFSTLGY